LRVWAEPNLYFPHFCLPHALVDNQASSGSDPRKSGGPPNARKSKDLGKVCALVTDGRFSGASSGPWIGHLSPEAAEGGLIGLVVDGEIVEIDIHNRFIHLAVDDATLAARRTEMEARPNPWQPKPRKRNVTTALRAYTALTTSAARGAVRDVDQLTRRS
jgi:dihydroxy-acid dehydratase